MIKKFKFISLISLITMLSGCAAEIGTAAHHAILESRLNSKWKGQSIQSLRNHVKEYKAVAVTMENGQQAYKWDFSHHYTRTVEVDSYAYHNTDRPGMTTGIVYADRDYINRCALYAFISPQNQMIVNIMIKHPPRGSCPDIRNSFF